MRRLNKSNDPNEEKVFELMAFYNEKLEQRKEKTYQTFNQLIISSGGIAALAMTLFGFLYDKLSENIQYMGHILFFKIALIFFGATIIFAAIRNYLYPRLEEKGALVLTGETHIDLNKDKMSENKAIKLEKNIKRTKKENENLNKTIGYIETFAYACYCLGVISLIAFTLMAI